MSKLAISTRLSLPLDAASDVTAIVGRRGRGKAIGILAKRGGLS